MALHLRQRHEQKTLSSGATTTLQIPTGKVIHDIILRFSTSADAAVTEAAIRSEIGNIRLTVDGVDLVNAAAAKILDLYEFLGRNVNDNAGVASVLELNVGRLVYTDPAVRELFGIGTADVQSIQVSITAGTLSTIALAQVFTTREERIANKGMFMRFINYARSFNSTGEDTMDTLPRDLDSSYLAVLVDPGASGTISHGEARVNNINVQDRLPASVNAQFLSNDRLATPSGYFVYSFTDGGLGTRLAMPGVTDLRFVTTFSVAPGAAGYNLSALTISNIPKSATF